MLTVGGSIRIERRYFWTPRCGGTYPIDEVIGIAAGSISAGAADFCCSMGSAQDFERAAEDLARIGGLRISKETLRQLVESAGQQVGIARASGALPPAWSADQAQVADTAKTRVYVGADGVKVRTVTQAEKDKRRHEHAVRRQQRGRSGVGNVKPLPPPRPGADEAFKEFKIGLLYDQGKIRKHMFATEGNHEVFGRLLRQHADAIELERAIEQISLTDGGPWIRNQILLHLKNLKATLLDFYHLSEHVWAAARCCLGEGQEAQHWAEARLHELKHTGYRPVLAAVDTLARKRRSPVKRKSLRLLRQYITERWEMVDYPAALARGWDIGSGPTEAACKNLTLRLKRTGMKWDDDNAAAMMNLVALRESGQWANYWSTRRSA
jgi:hypothetical protein